MENIEFIKRTLEADFDYEVRDNHLIVIYDLDSDENKATVTNAVHSVLDEITKELKHSLAGYTIIYRDSSKIFDGIAVDEQGKFKEFYSINETNIDSAISKILPC